MLIFYIILFSSIIRRRVGHIFKRLSIEHLIRHTKRLYPQLIIISDEYHLCVMNAKALSIMLSEDDINTEQNIKSIWSAAVAQWTRLTRTGKREFETGKAQIFFYYMCNMWELRSSRTRTMQKYCTCTHIGKYIHLV